MLHTVHRYRDETDERYGHANGQHHVDGQHRLHGDRVEPRVVLQQGLRVDIVLPVDVVVRARVHRVLRIGRRWVQQNGDFDGRIRNAAQLRRQDVADRQHRLEHCHHAGIAEASATGTSRGLGHRPWTGRGVDDRRTRVSDFLLRGLCVLASEIRCHLRRRNL